MIDYQGKPDTLSFFQDTVPVPVSEYRLLVEAAERGRVMAEGILSAMQYNGDRRYAMEVSITADFVISIFRAVYPEDYDLWLEEEKKRAEEGRKEATGYDPV
jgi:hypothetical protein